ncbi:MAG: TerB family tellurite resistance protein [Myxococcales bacterium]|nr:TerB family tellurite resistance protein [Myxococcales bacterium]MCB9692837.1 TerB family tellurite resistance protein [Alphaproteobacteria bacterium]
METAPPPEAFSLDAIRPLVALARVDGRDIHAVFRCPTTATVEQVHWRAPPAGVSAVTAQLKATSTLYGVRTQVNGLVRGMLGYGTLGRWARMAADATLAGQHPGAQLATDEEEQGIVDAFRSVAHRFEWTGRSWVHRVDEPVGALEARVAGGPELTGYDRDVASRMVVAVASAHGGISDEERSHLLDIFEDAGSLERLLGRPPLTDAELAETTRGATRRALLAVTWSMALCDEHFDPAEQAVLERFARALGIGLEEQIAIQQEAQVFVVEQLLERTLAWGAHDATARQQLAGLADRIGMSRGMLERTEARFLKKTRGG